MGSKSLAEKVVDRMYAEDYFSQWLGIERIDEGDGFAVLKMQVRKNMLNGFGIAHGGITYSLADSALAFAANSLGKRCVSIETSIAHTESCKEGDWLTATARQVQRSNKIGRYAIEVKDQDERIVGLFNGTVYVTSKDWF